MSNWIVTDKIQEGDIIEGPIIWAPFLKHYGVAVLVDGKMNIAQQSGRKFEIIPLEQALEQRPVERVLRTGLASELILERAKSCHKNNYSLLFYNCEDVITALTGEVPGVDQRRSIATIFLIIVIISLIYLLRK